LYHSGKSYDEDSNMGDGVKKNSVSKALGCRVMHEEKKKSRKDLSEKVLRL
jgi:hypothetical protein